MSFHITCPYCFAEFADHDVHFRSERVNRGENDILPDEYYGDFDRFMDRYDKPDKEVIRRRYLDWDFFAETEDETYKSWWQRFGGTTEVNPEDDNNGFPAYRRRVIDPSNPEHQRYLKRQEGGGWYGRDEGNGMVSYVELSTGEKCNRRVCPRCHNPLPANYGLYDQSFVSVIGVTDAGKTVYLSQLLRGMGDYAASVGLYAHKANANTKSFITANSIAAGQSLPAPTPYQRLQQPLFYDLERDLGGGSKESQTFVLYDVAGEVFKDNNSVSSFAPFISHSQGLLLLIKPMQFKRVNERADDTDEDVDPVTALDAIHAIVNHGNPNEKCKVPLAVCISQVDRKEVQDVLPDDLKERLLEDYNGVRRRGSGLNAPVFNAHDYNPIVRGLDEWIQQKGNALALAQALETAYADYSYFAFTALGCEVVDGVDRNGVSCKVPEGPITPKRIEEPVLWMFHRLGYISANEPLYNPAGDLVPCPNPSCDCDETDALPAGSYVTEGLIFKRKVPVNRKCPKCGTKFWHEENAQ